MSLLRSSLVVLLIGASALAGLGVSRSADHEAATTTVVYIVRHAEKVDASADADLSETGKSRAAVLKWTLKDVPLDAVFSTNVRRTRKTVEPVAKANRRTIETYLARPGELARIINDRYRGKTLLVCGHSNTIPRLLGELDVGIKEKLLAGYDDLFIVVLHWDESNKLAGTTLQRLHYPNRR